MHQLGKLNVCVLQCTVMLMSFLWNCYYAKPLLVGINIKKVMTTNLFQLLFQTGVRNVIYVVKSLPQLNPVCQWQYISQLQEKCLISQCNC